MTIRSLYNLILGLWYADRQYAIVVDGKEYMIDTITTDENNDGSLYYKLNCKLRNKTIK